MSRKNNTTAARRWIQHRAVFVAQPLSSVRQWSKMKIGMPIKTEAYYSSQEVNFMLIINANAYLDGTFVYPVCVRLADDAVQEVGFSLLPLLGEEVLDLCGDYLLPGFVDVHIHGFAGRDAMEGEQAVRAMSRGLYQQGVAAFLPTTMSALPEDTRQAVEGVRAVMAAPEEKGARVLGTHMEAPFLNEEKCGAQQKQYFCDPSMEQMLLLTVGRLDGVKMITLAPERDGAEVFVRAMKEAGVVTSVGHTAATAEQTHLAADWGATHVTHTFNAQSPLGHRAPGVPGAALTDDRLYTEMIADGVHLHGDILRLMIRAKGAERTVAITDAMEAAGMPDGSYALGGQKVLVRDGQARLEDGTLAGSVLTMHGALENLIHRFDVLPEDAVRMCTLTPAESIGEEKAGRITPGAPLPLTRWSKAWRMMGIVE
ncbi:MAG: N-acetylglucosamine-6-phosphate deacetylase [Clostridiales bacterium]|nr:N-acetylglucosamine-6-phosphate deacetylase [Clostridiales bacterium]